MRRQHDGVARFDRDQDFENRGRGWVRGRNDSGDNTTRAGNLYNIFRLRNYALRAQTAKVVPDVFRGETVLLSFVVSNSVSGFFNSHRSEVRGLTQRSLRHGLANAID